jgi:hypothetical protein
LAFRSYIAKSTAIGLLFAAVLALTVVADAQTLPSAAALVAIEVRAEPVAAFDVRDPARRQFGLLEFRGGLALRSTYKNFGGMSAIRVASDGEHFIALSDKGWWFRGRIVYEGSRPNGIVEAEMAPILGPDGQPLAARGWYDTESIAEDGGTLYVGIERVHQIVRFNYGKEGLFARGRPIPPPPGFRSLPFNRGLEALVFVPKGLPLGGTLIAISERGLDSAGNISGFLLGGPRPGGFAVRRSSSYDVSDAALLPGGDVLLLERQAQLDQRPQCPHTAHRAWRDKAGRDGGRSRSTRGGSRLRDRQHGRPQRSPQCGGRDRAHAHFRR